MRIVFKNVTVVNADGREVRDVFVSDGKIVSEFKDADRVVEGEGKFLIPGAIDPHVHFREPGAEYKEVWESGSAAAAMGGVTTVLDMPNNNPAIINQKNLDLKKELVKGRSYVNYAFHFGGTANTAAFEEAEGMAGVKVYMGSSTGDLLLDDDSAWEKIFQIAKAKDIPVIVHAENEERIRERSIAMASEMEDIQTHAKIRDCECAHIAADAAVALREKVGNKLHIAHMSTKSEAELMREHAHPDLTCEVCPHHLYFTMEDMKDSFLKMNPPLRHSEDVDALWTGLQDGTVTSLSTDHAPHTIEEKTPEKGWGPSGVPGVQHLLPLMLNEVNEGRFNLERVVELTSVGTARIFSLRGKGRVEEGMDADLTLLDMDMEHTVVREDVKSKCGWSPYEGRKIKGWPVMTIVNGQIVMEDRKIVGETIGLDVMAQSNQ